MLAAKFISSAPKVRAVLTQSSRQMSAISGPPQVKISLAEKLVHGVIITSGILAIPAWVLVNLQSYKGQE